MSHSTCAVQRCGQGEGADVSALNGTSDVPVNLRDVVADGGSARAQLARTWLAPTSAVRGTSFHRALRMNALRIDYCERARGRIADAL